MVSSFLKFASNSPFLRAFPTLSTLRTFIRTFSLTLLYITTPFLYISRYHACLYQITGPSMSPTLSPDYHETRARDAVIFFKNIRAPGPHPSRGGGSNDITCQAKAASIYRRDDDLRSQEEKENADHESRTLRRGQIIAFYTPHHPEKLAVKRIVAMAGDVVCPQRRDTSPYYPPPSAESSYHTLSSSTIQHQCPASGYDHYDNNNNSDNDNTPRVTIPHNHIWVEGDNTSASTDSNDYGPISISLVDGIAGSIVWPRARAGPRDWEGDGWEARCKGRVEWKGRGSEGEVPEEWVMQ